jgi:hypothetical protein
VSGFSGTSGTLGPSVSLRAGRLDRAHLRAEYSAPHATMPVGGDPRVGIALNQGREHALRLYTGVALAPLPRDKRRAGGFADVALALGALNRRAGFSLQGFLTLDHDSQLLYSGGVGFWLHP